MKKPDFFIIGAPKCGTTAMNAYLSAHPQVFMAPEKEMHHFSTDLDIPARARFRDATTYLAQFADADGYQRVGEASVWYLFSTKAAGNIYRFNPDAQIMAMLRNPVDMIYSLHSQLVFGDDEPLGNFEDALIAEARRRTGHDLPKMVFAPIEALFYRNIPMYSQQLQRYFDMFGRSNVHVILFDDFKTNTAGVYQDTLAFLNVDTDFRPDFEVVNANAVVKNRQLSNMLTARRPNWYARTILPAARRALPAHLRHNVNRRLRKAARQEVPRPKIPPHLRSELEQHFSPEIDRLSALLDRDLTLWLKE